MTISLVNCPNAKWKSKPIVVFSATYGNKSSGLIKRANRDLSPHQKFMTASDGHIYRRSCNDVETKREEGGMVLRALESIQSPH